MRSKRQTDYQKEREGRGGRERERERERKQLYMYLSRLVCYTLEYPLNGWHIKVDVVLQVKTLHSQSVLYMVRVPLHRKCYHDDESIN